MNNIFFLSLCIPVLFGCASGMSREQCQTTNWEAQGEQDGSNGLPLKFIENRQKECRPHDVNVNTETYNKGHAKGLQKYCTPSHFYFAAESGRSASADACPVEQRSSLEKSYQEGQKLFALKQREQSLQREIKNVQGDKSFVADLGRANFILGGESPTARQETALMEVKQQILQLQSSAPDTTEFCTEELKQKSILLKNMPDFLLNMTPGGKESLQSCSRNAGANVLVR